MIDFLPRVNVRWWGERKITALGSGYEAELTLSRISEKVTNNNIRSWIILLVAADAVINYKAHQTFNGSRRQEYLRARVLIEKARQLAQKHPGIMNKNELNLIELKYIYALFHTQAFTEATLVLENLKKLQPTSEKLEALQGYILLSQAMEQENEEIKWEQLSRAFDSLNQVEAKTGQADIKAYALEGAASVRILMSKLSTDIDAAFTHAIVGLDCAYRAWQWRKKGAGYYQHVQGIYKDSLDNINNHCLTILSEFNCAKIILRLRKECERLGELISHSKEEAVDGFAEQIVVTDRYYQRLMSFIEVEEVRKTALIMDETPDGIVLEPMELPKKTSVVYQDPGYTRVELKRDLVQDKQILNQIIEENAFQVLA